MVFEYYMRSFFVLFSLITVVDSDGELFIGFLGYLNSNNTDINGDCCSPAIDDGTCGECHLSFEVSVQGINSSDSDGVYPQNGDSIPSQAAKEFKIDANTLRFPFVSWPGEVNITIQVSHKVENTSHTVDKFVFVYKSDKPHWEYIQENVDGTKQSPSRLKLVLRYNCGILNQAEGTCYDDSCTPHNDVNKCTPDPQPQTNSTAWIILQPSTQSRECGQIAHGNLTEFLNCTTDSSTIDTTESFTTESQSFSTENPETTTWIPSTNEITDGLTTQEAATAFHTSLQTTVESKVTTDFDQTLTTDFTTTTVTTTTEGRTSEAAHTISQTRHTTENRRSTTAETTHKQTTKQIITSQPSTVSTIVTTKSPVVSTGKNDIGISVTDQPSKPSTIVVDINTTVKEGNDDGAMQYWPGIVGGVLGACLVAAIVSFIIYNRKRRLQKNNNDIYNVNPKRWVFDQTENGTSGKSEIALETEPV